jgi:nitrogen fixation protein NifU and related proteins
MKYSKETMKRFLDPQNFGRLDNFNAIGKVGNPRCGDLMEITMLVENNIIKEIKFHTLGCAAAISVSDVVCDLVKGKTLQEAQHISEKEISEALEYLPRVKMHCASLAREGIKKAIENYK